NLSSTPVIGCLEVSGGLPRCSRSKEWGDTLKLGLELRDLWVIAGDHLTGVDISELVLWGLIVV
ncbi:13519_t:CDS:1, partial [Entrophospora sp. SA101]